MRREVLNDKGFTFLELLIVIIIFGILITIAYPKFEKEKARWELNAVARQMVTDIRDFQQQAVMEQKSGLKIVIYSGVLQYHLKEYNKTKKIRDLSGVLKSLNTNLPSGSTINFGLLGGTNNYCTITLQNRFGEYKYVVINSVGRVRLSSTKP